MLSQFGGCPISVLLSFCVHCTHHSECTAFFFRFAHICVSFVYMAHLFSMSGDSCLTCFDAFCFCAVCPCFF